MLKVFQKLKAETQNMVQGQKPSFYTDLKKELFFAEETFLDHPLIARCKEDVLPFLNDSYGHGIEHSRKVGIEAAALILYESRNMLVDMRKTRQLALLAQLAGLFHDTCRLQKKHAYKGAELALNIMAEYPLSMEDKQIIAFAVSNHEAFQQPDKTLNFNQKLVSNALYDADKFRWGPDNFVTTVWEICTYKDWTLENLADKIPYGIEKINQIAKTFRSNPGKIYGPEFINLGLKIGQRLQIKINQLCIAQK